MSTRKFGGRTLARSQALQLLFQSEINGLTVAEVLAGPYALSQWPLDEYGEELARGADNMRHELDAVISEASTSWKVGRMPVADRNLLRLALYEMLSEEEVAVAVTIDESVELAKAYGGSDDSPRFINGILGRVASDLEAGIDVVGVAVTAAAADENATETDEGDADESAAEADEASTADESDGEAGVRDAKEA